jgi:GT2 family glycosyltransferase
MHEFDVVILSWNRAELTKETVENILDQENVLVNIWLIDQGSRAEDLIVLRELAERRSNVHLHEVGKNLGVPGGRNLGMSLGKAPYIVCIDNDAIFEKQNALEVTGRRFERSPELGVIGLRYKNYYTREDDDLWWVYPKAQLSMRNDEFLTTRFMGGGHAIRRSVLEEVGGYDEKLFYYWEEVDLSNKLINHGYQIIYTPEVSFFHKVSPEARVQWKQGRFYYVTRNALYLHFKYYRDPAGMLVLAGGYLLKGLFNRIPGQALRGITGAVGMCIKAWPEIRSNQYTLNEKAREYIYRNEKLYRGSVLNRIQREVLVDLSRRG